jgi:CBS domain-containing protein
VNAKTMIVRDLMSAAGLRPAVDVPARAKLLIENDCGAIPIVSDNKSRKPVGIVTDRDIACRAVAEGKNTSRLTAADCMSTPCLTTGEETSLEDCCRLMEANRVRRIVVVDDGDGAPNPRPGGHALAAPEKVMRSRKCRNRRRGVRPAAGC